MVNLRTPHPFQNFISENYFGERELYALRLYALCALFGLGSTSGYFSIRFYVPCAQNVVYYRFWAETMHRILSLSYFRLNRGAFSSYLVFFDFLTMVAIINVSSFR